jgi:hypothetical protein
MMGNNIQQDDICWTCFDHQFLKIGNRCQCIDNASLRLNYPLNRGPNDDAP